MGKLLKNRNHSPLENPNKKVCLQTNPKVLFGIKAAGISEWSKPDRWPEEADRNQIPGQGSGPAGVEAL
jgi:hypothetical protein